MKRLMLIAIVAIVACTSPERQVNDGLAAFRKSIYDMNVDATVALLAPSASISHADQPPVIGAAAIAAFLRTFAGYHVTDYQMTGVSTRVNGDAAEQHGHYHQAVTTPDGKPVEVNGVFEADWRKHDGHWRIERMHTAPQ
ncbi:MAG TPA: nuclear transport factor 2 family protein [Kofleriaceae bacterium]|nr:nuclear transport factor 2 family protein [Kofleriaceae bacterium]